MKKPRPPNLNVVANIKVVIDVSCCDKSTVCYEANFRYKDAQKYAKKYIDEVIKLVEEE